MPEKILFLEFFQPFAQYRNPFTFYYAQTYPLPPKSTIIGMLQNVIGDWYGNRFGIENWWNLKISVHGGFESVFWNYQQLIKGELGFTTQGIWINRHDKNPGGKVWLPLYNEGLKSQRVPIHQQELFNGYIYIFIKGSKDLVDEIKKSLQNPQKILYLGRSEDILFIKNIKEISFSKPIKVEGDIKLKYPTFLIKEINGKEFPIKQQKFPVYSIPIKVIFENNGIPIKSKAQITKGTERKAQFKTVIYTGLDYSIILKDGESIEVEIYEIDDKEFKVLNNFGWL